MKIPEIEEPKIHTMGFKVSEKDKKLIEAFCKKKNYRPSAFMRVSILMAIKNDEKA